MTERVLFVGITDSLSDDVLDALGCLGHTCLFFNQRGSLTFRYSLVRKVLRAVPALEPLRAWDVRRMNRRLIAAAGQFKPTILLVWNGERIHPETVHAIHNQGAITVNWFLDFMTHWPSIKRIAPLYDFFFTPDRRVIEALGAVGVRAHHASFGCRAVFEHFPEGPRPYPVTFVGSYGPSAWTKREDFLAVAGDVGLHIWGPPSWRQTRLKEFYRGAARGEAMLQKYSKSQIAIDVPWDHLDADAISIRPFEVTAAGACLFFYDIRPEMRHMYEADREYVPFTTATELQAKLRHYLAHPAELESIARAGYARFMRNHTYVHRLREIIATVRKSS